MARLWVFLLVLIAVLSPDKASGVLAAARSKRGLDIAGSQGAKNEDKSNDPIKQIDAEIS